MWPPTAEMGQEMFAPYEIRPPVTTNSFSLHIVGNRAESACRLIFIWLELTSASIHP